MKDLSEDLAAHFEGEVTTLCWCWRIERSDGVVLGFTDHDKPLFFDGVTYQAASGFTQSELQSSLGLSVNNSDIQGALSSDVITESDISAGLYDAAKILTYRVNWQSTDQVLLMRTGHFGEVTRGSLGFQAEIRGLAHEMQQVQGRLYQRSCDATLGDARCGVDLSSLAYTAQGASVIGLSSASTFIVSGLSSYEDGWFDRGQAVFETGDNAGQSFLVGNHSSVTASYVQISLASTPSQAISLGDTVTFIAGCSKKIGVCRDKFSNAINFRGFPHMPGNDLIVSYPTTSDAGLDGTTRYDEY